MKFGKVVLLLLVISLLGGCSYFSKSSKSIYQDKSADQVYAMGQSYLHMGKYASSVQAFEHLQANYPFGSHARQTDLNIIYAYYMSGNYIAAKASSERFIHLYPTDSDVDYPYYMRGLSDFKANRSLAERRLPIDMSQRDLAQGHTAFNEFNELITRFPHSKYDADARQRMVYLRNLFAEHEINVAKFYLSRGANVAVINRCEYVLTNYRHSPQTADAFALMYKAYNKMGMHQQAQDSLALLAKNFPGSKQLTFATTKYHRPWYSYLV